MAYYYSDADLYPNQYQYQHQQQFQYQHNYQYHYAQPQTLVPQTYYYSDGFNCYELSNGYCNWYGDQSTRYPIAYSVAAGYSEPKRVTWEDGGVDRVNVDLVVDGEEEFDDDYDDDDYDPTPYGGGYDLVAAYGKPLPASDAICYPRSGNDSEIKAVVASDAVPVEVQIPDHVPMPVSNAMVLVDGFENDSGGDVSESETSSGSEMSEVDEGNEEASGGDVRLSENGLNDDSGGGGDEEEYGGGGGDREFAKVPVIGDAPNGYESKSESPGFCDGLFGYLPCLNKKRNRTVISGNGWVEKADEDQWKAAADFLFGSLNPYADGV